MSVSNRGFGLMSAALALVVLVGCSGKSNPSNGGGADDVGGTVGGTVDGGGGGKAKAYTLTAAASPADGGGVSLDPDQAQYDAGAKVTAAAVPNEGYEFTGWSGASKSKDAEITVTMNGDKALVANFQKQSVAPPPGAQSYVLTVAPSPADGGSVSLNPTQARYDAGTQVTLVATPKTGYYEFAGWSWVGGSSTSTGLLVVMDKDKEITANFKAILRTITVTAMDGGKATISPEQTSHPVGAQVTLTAVPDEGYFFAGWNASKTKTNPISITVDKDQEITAYFVQGYKLNVGVDQNIRGGVSVSPAQPANGYPPGSQVKVTATSKYGYKFTAWSGASTSKDNAVTITMNGDASLKANFEPTVEYTLTLNVASGGGGTATASTTGPYYHGTQATATATPNDGYGFAEWSGASTSTDSRVNITMDGDKTLTAKFARVYTLTTKVQPEASGGKITRNPNKTSYLEGTQVTLSPMPKGDNDYAFVGWAGEPSYPSSITITMDSDKTFTANYEKVYKLTTSVKPDYSGTVSCDHDLVGTWFRAGAQVTLTAKPGTGYRFAGWGNGITDVTIKYTIINGDNKITANFERIPDTGE